MSLLFRSRKIDNQTAAPSLLSSWNAACEQNEIDWAFGSFCCEGEFRALLETRFELTVVCLNSKHQVPVSHRPSLHQIALSRWALSHSRGGKPLDFLPLMAVATPVVDDCDLLQLEQALGRQHLALFPRC